MLLQRLVEYSHRLDLPPPMYEEAPIKWLLDISRDGQFRAFVRTSGGEREDDRGRLFRAPHALATSGTVPKLLFGSCDYVLGLSRGRHEKASSRHEAFVQLTRQCFEKTGDDGLQAVVRFLDALDLSRIPIPEDLDPSDWVTFSVGGSVLFERDRISNFWLSYQEEKLTKGATVCECVLCGKMRKPVAIHPIKIKRIGGQPSGASIVSANAPAFMSYGLKQSFNAPTCLECADRYAKAANTLIRDDRTHLSIGSHVYIFWTREEAEFSVALLLSDPTPDKVKELLKSAFSGRAGTLQIDSTPFYAASLSPSGGRVAVRNWLGSTIGVAKRNLARFFRLQRLLGNDGQEDRPYGIFPLAAALFHDPRKEMPPNVLHSLLHFALQGGPLSHWLFFLAVKRCRAERAVTRPRAILLKMGLLSVPGNGLKEERMERLDPELTTPAYLCGRLFAVLENLQKTAVPRLAATLIDQFYGIASSAPASIFGKILRGSQAHLGKLRKTRPGVFTAIQQRIEEVVSKLPAFPPTLTLQEQGLFALGYYHQRAFDSAAARAYCKAKEREPAEPDGR